ncbi:hypothetical protein L1887_05657 [Cichorium endivia]|nr:hypothetical protein L1887_05657 [Cichorium endivia]
MTTGVSVIYDYLMGYETFDFPFLQPFDYLMGYETFDFPFLQPFDYLMGYETVEDEQRNRQEEEIFL